MTTVIADMSMTLDGFVADPADRIDHVFTWYHKGRETVTMPGGVREFRIGKGSADELRAALASAGAMVCGRRMFDLTNGWDGQPPIGVPVYVVTHTAPDDWAHPDAPFTFVTDGLDSAITRAKATAGDKNVVIACPTIAQQCLNAGLLDAIRLSVVPVLLGEGVRFFDNLHGTPIELDDHPRVTEGIGVTHLWYRVKKPTGRTASPLENGADSSP
ncbi:MAG: dihydrofolate reductase family protein [Kutzneria sp.]|nr:dihydrofolate reductase family protein [Kutzneria sp.]MBV9847357.1 dihydrofolate reductase family protein [Kutzneria sp.]